MGKFGSFVIIIIIIIIIILIIIIRHAFRERHKDVWPEVCFIELNAWEEPRTANSDRLYIVLHIKICSYA
jgi:predicted RNase H-like nuclease